jgi:hypothetical protein
MAETRLSEALQVASELGVRPVVAACHTTRADLYRRIGREEAAIVEEAAARETAPR